MHQEPSIERLTVSHQPASSKASVTIVRLEGVLVINNVPIFEKLIEELMTSRKYKIILNLGKLTYISSAGIGAVMGVIKEIRAKGGDIKMTHVSADVFKIFELLEIPAYFQVLKNDEDAVTAF